MDPDEQTRAQKQLGRRRFTRTPGYYGQLPKVFPFRLKTAKQDAMTWVSALAQDIEIAGFGFAVTSHPADQFDVVTLWLSAECAEYLERNGYCRAERI